MFLPVTRESGGKLHQLQALDSGAAGNFMDIAMASRLQVPVNPLSPPLEIIALDGRSIPWVCYQDHWPSHCLTVSHFGLTNAPDVFQALINDVLQDMLNKFVFVYLDDI